MSISIHLKLAAAAGAALLAACAPVDRAAAPQGILIRNVTVIPIDRPGSIESQDVLVVGGRIAAIGRTGSVGRAPAQVIDGTGRYLMPGLWDMHVHATVRTDDAAGETLPLYLGHGIVGVRDLGSTMEALNRTRAALAGRNDLPEMVASGPLLDGPRQPWSQTMARSLGNADEARAAAEELAAAGVDFLKVYTSLSPDQHGAVAAVARRRRLPFAGHVPLRMTVEQVSASGQASIEHSGVQLIADCVPDGVRAVPAVLGAWISDGFPGRFRETARIWATRDEAACRALYRRMAQRGTRVTPTLVNDIKGAGWTWPEELAPLPVQLREACSASTASIDREPALRDAAARLQLDQVRELHEEGVQLLAGSDTPNECLWHGVSLHRELQLLNRAGLSPLETLRTATLNPARFLGRANEGRVAVGAAANLLLLDADPLADIANTRRIAGTMLRGRWHDSAALRRLREGPRASTTVYDNAMVWTGAGFEQRRLAVREGRFVDPAAVAGGERIDLGGRFVVPAYGNAHAHLTSPTMRQSWAFLEQGVFYVWNPTSVVLGRDALAFFARPDTFDVRVSQGGITEPGGHPEKLYVDVLARHVYRGRGLDWFLGNAFHYGRDRAEIDSALDRLKAQNADFVKVYLLHSEEYRRRRDDPAYYGHRGVNPANLPYLVAAARRRGLFVAAHVETAADLRVAALSGVQVAAHLPLYWAVGTQEELRRGTLSQEDAALVARSGMAVVPTYAIAAADGIEGGPSSGPRATRAEVFAAQARNLRLLAGAGVNFLIGTDTAGPIFEEVEHLVGIGAFQPAEALAIALGTGRRLFPERRIGCFEAGCEADFLVLEDDPTRDVRALRRIARRIKAGRELRPPPEEPQQR